MLKNSVKQAHLP